MARIGEFYIGGKEGHPLSGETYFSGVAFELTSDSKLDVQISFSNDGHIWDIAIKQNHDLVVAICKDILMPEEILISGFDSCQKFLDLLSINLKTNLEIKNPEISHFLLFNNSNETVFREISLVKVGLEISFEITIKDKDGNIKPQSPEQYPSWITAFRYYRLSQISKDIFEAYRNLFLGFESLLDTILPKQKGIKEIQWFEEALKEVNKKTPLSKFVPSGTIDPVDYIVKSQYLDIRVKLFHAKNQIILPYESPDRKIVVEGYVFLIKLWRQIAIDFFNVSSSSTVLNMTAFNERMKNMFDDHFSIQVTDDDSPENPSDTEVSPKKFPVFVLDNHKIIGDYSEGRIILSGNLINDELKRVKSLHRICVIVDDIVFSEQLIKGGIILEGIDRFESYQSIGLINKNTPKTYF